MLLMTRFMLIPFAFAALVACDAPPSSGGVSRSGGGMSTALPDPNVAGLPKVLEWSQATARNDLTNQVIALCGRAAPSAPAGMKNKQKIKFYDAQIPTIPDRAACWARTAPTLIEKRGNELAYARAVTRDLGGFGPNKASDLTVPTMQQELVRFEQVFRRDFANARRSLRESAGDARYNERQRKASNAAAWGMALDSFSRDNPFTRPQPGIQDITRTSRMVWSATPAQVLAMEAMDRTLFGDDAYFRAVERDAIAAAAAVRNRPQPEDDNSPITLQQSRYCYGSRPNGQCLTLAEYDAQVSADTQARDDAFRAEAAQSLAQGRVASERLAQQRRLGYAQARGYNSWDAYKASGGYLKL